MNQVEDLIQFIFHLIPIPDMHVERMAQFGIFDDASITDISPSDNASNLQSICFPVDNKDGKVCGQTTIARYKNNTWNNLQFYNSTIFYNSIFFINDTTGWAVWN